MTRPLSFFLLFTLTTSVTSFSAVKYASHGPGSVTIRNSPLSATVTSDDALDVAIVGGGPCGLLLAHALTNEKFIGDNNKIKITLYEGRPTPNTKSSASPTTSQGRAYALGLGTRARTAIKECTAGENDNNNDISVWEKLKQVGFPSDRFELRVGSGFKLRLRDSDPKLQPSYLMYQSDLCRVLSETLDKSKIDIKYDCKVDDISINDNVSMTTNSGETKSHDIVFGCDGANSVVRNCISTASNDYIQAKQETIPGLFKAVRLDQMPTTLDNIAVSLLIPSKGACTAFVEPTFNNTCCILFAARDANDTVISSSNVTELEQEIAARFPLLADASAASAATNLAKIDRPGRAASIQCNIYHYRHQVALLGDAAHATGGVSGQGVNSALMDSYIMAECLASKYFGSSSNDSSGSSKQERLRSALLAYSQRQVPEGKALYDLSFGPNSKSPLKKFAKLFNDGLDITFKGEFGIGRLPLQTLVTLSLTPFADIRRQRNNLYDDEFPSDYEWQEKLAKLDATAESSKTTVTK